MTVVSPAGPLDFDLPEELIATAPPEARGLRRDEVRLLVARPEGLAEATFRDLPAFLDPGDLLVINVSATLPAAVPVQQPVVGVAPGSPSGPGGRLLHLSTRLPGGLWLVEPRRPAGAGSLPLPGGGRPGEVLELPGGASALLLGPWPAGSDLATARLWVATLVVPSESVHAWLCRHGRPIRYGDRAGPWPLSSYQTVFATEPGSAEMPSAGRAFTPELLTALLAKGVGVTPLVLHTGVSSQEAGEPPYPEWYRVPAETAARVNATRSEGGRVIAVGTTVTRALETVAGPDGRARAAEGWTELVLGPEHDVRLVDGIITGWHEPQASHLSLLTAVADAGLVAASYETALARGFLWHHFGDLALLLPGAAAPERST
jgi:S-adenosylmethionine:tRNA ribosyltransferase-isomerase